MSDLAFEAAVRAASAKKPPGMGDFAVREMVRAALGAVRPIGESTTTGPVGLAYLATPYSKYPGGIEAAWVDACALAARLLVAGLGVYSPIAHTHPLAIHGGLDPLDHDIWLPFDEAMMAKADELIVAHMATWETSRGIAHEVAVFEAAGKPVYDLDPDSLTMRRREAGPVHG